MMKEHYDFSKAVRKNPYIESLKKGYKVRVTRGEGDDMEIVEEYFVPPDEPAEQQRAAQ
jgi:hypothetical protein